MGSKHSSFGFQSWMLGRSRCTRRAMIHFLCAMMILASQPASAQAPDLMRDGNVVTQRIETQSGRKLFATNAALTEGANFTKIFGPHRPTTLWDDDRRRSTYVSALFATATRAAGN